MALDTEIAASEEANIKDMDLMGDESKQLPTATREDQMNECFESAQQEDSFTSHQRLC